MPNDNNLKPNSSLKRPRITEKAAVSADKHNVYVFEVEKGADKSTISASVKNAYNVSPLKVRIVNIPARKVVVRGKMGSKAGVKKAYVELKKGDKIELI